MHSQYANRQIFWDAEEERYLIKLYKKGRTHKQISVLLNDKFDRARTARSVQARIERINKKNYTVETDKLIIAAVRQYPLNLQYAFKIACKEINAKYKLDIKPISIQGRYYSFVRKNYEIITTGSNAGFSINVKNKHRKDNKLPKQNLKPVQSLLKQILNLSDKERALLIDLLTI